MIDISGSHGGEDEDFFWDFASRSLQFEAQVPRIFSVCPEQLKCTLKRSISSHNLTHSLFCIILYVSFQLNSINIKFRFFYNLLDDVIQHLRTGVLSATHIPHRPWQRHKTYPYRSIIINHSDVTTVFMNRTRGYWILTETKEHLHLCHGVQRTE